MAFSRNFLTDIAQEKELSQRERDVFLALLGDDKSRPQIAEMLHLSTSAVSTCLTGIYRKFQIAGSGPVKESRLKDYLTNRYRRLKSENSEDSSIIDSGELSIDALVRDVRSRCCEAILENYSKIRLPDDTRIDVDLLYVDVYVLEKLSSKRYASISGLLEGVEQREGYERLALGQRQKRLPGQEIVRQFPRLMVLGKPGSGKTTFLRHLAVDCSKGKFFCDRIPVLIELRSLKEGNSFNLLNLIHREFGLAQQEQTQQILNQGKAFILLDGLDEVPSQVRQSVRDQIYEFAKEYGKNRFVLTCRTQTVEYIADHFEPIEVANFDAEQVKIFARNWFTATPETSGVAEGWTSRFVGKLEENQQIRELAVTPILLTLTCLLFTAQQDLPKKRSELYEKGIDLLLKQWDRFREIPRDYQQLSVSAKQKLLSYLAFRKFEQPDNFILFEQDEIQGYIADHLGIDAEESEALLEAIEAHHGLLIERAQSIWSFSHLTFQEYFTARKIVATCNSYATNEPMMQGLVNHISEKRWREVFLLTVGMLDSADALLRLMKAQIDGLLATDEKLQQFLTWVHEKTQLVEVSYKFAAVRAYYIDANLSHICATGPFVAYNLTLSRVLDPDFTHAIENHNLDLSRALDNCYSVIESPALSLVFTHGIDPHDLFAYALALNLVRPIAPDSIWWRSLQELKNQLPDTSWESLPNFQKWWQECGSAWTEQLRTVMIEHRNIGHDWQLSNAQTQLLQQYYDSHKLLVDCLNSDCYVSRKVRQEIEETLLLPIEEIKKRRSRRDDGVIGECNKNDEKT
jgi:predicted NACHT family NTPase